MARVVLVVFKGGLGFCKDSDDNCWCESIPKTSLIQINLIKGLVYSKTLLNPIFVYIFY